MENEKDLKLINPWRLFTGAIIPNWLLERTEVSPGAKLCYARLCQYAGKKGECFPKQRTLGIELGVEPRQIRRYLDELEALRLIKAFKVEYQGQNIYRFFYHSWMSEAAPMRSDMTTLDRTDKTTLERSDMTALYSIRESNRRESSEEYSEKVNDFFNALEPEWLGEVKKAFPQVNLHAELNKMKAWLISNQDKPKKNIKRFAVNWLSRNKSDFHGESREVTKTQQLGAAGKVLN